VHEGLGGLEGLERFYQLGLGEREKRGLGERRRWETRAEEHRARRRLGFLSVG
jgi:hypothetical protein